MLLFGLLVAQSLASTVIDPVYWRVDNTRLVFLTEFSKGSGVFMIKADFS